MTWRSTVWYQGPSIVNMPINAESTMQRLPQHIDDDDATEVRVKQLLQARSTCMTPFSTSQNAWTSLFMSRLHRATSCRKASLQRPSSRVNTNALLRRYFFRGSISHITPRYEGPRNFYYYLFIAAAPNEARVPWRECRRLPPSQGDRRNFFFFAPRRHENPEVSHIYSFTVKYCRSYRRRTPSRLTYRGINAVWNDARVSKRHGTPETPNLRIGRSNLGIYSSLPHLQWLPNSFSPQRHPRHSRYKVDHQQTRVITQKGNAWPVHGRLSLFK